MTLVKRPVKKILLKGSCYNGILWGGREIGFNSKYNRENDAPSSSVGEWSVDGKLLRGSSRDKGVVAKAI